MTSLQPAAAVFVKVEIEPDRIPAFFEAMEVDAKGSRDVTKDPGCLRFDFLTDSEAPNTFYFYEAYTTDESAAFHKTTAHYKAWADFKAAGGVKNQEVIKMVTVPGADWGFQPNDAPSSRVGFGVLVTVDIQPDRTEDFLQVMRKDVVGTRSRMADEALRFDLMMDKDKPHRYYFYEAYQTDEAAKFHKTTEHYKAWADFKAGGGVVGATTVKWNTASLPHTWGFQSASVKLGSVEMPLLGFGCYKVGVVPASATAAVEGAPPPPGGPEVCQRIIKDAVTIGYPMFDSAQFYENEAWIGDALKVSGMRRDRLFIISKVWNDVVYEGPDAVKKQVDKTLAELKCDYLDLCLVHWPVPGKHVEAYKALLEYKAAGKVKEVGISNYTIQDYQTLKDAGVFGENDKDKPVLNQIEVNPNLYRKETIDFFQKEGVHIQAYRGLMTAGEGWKLPALEQVCTETGKKPSQVLGRFLVQQGISHIPKASSPERMLENADIFGFQLTAEQMEKLSGLTTPQALEAKEALHKKCIVRDTPEA